MFREKEHKHCVVEFVNNALLIIYFCLFILGERKQNTSLLGDVYHNEQMKLENVRYRTQFQSSFDAF